MNLVNKKELAEELGISTKTVDRRVDAGRLPPPFRLSRQSPRWDLNEVYDHLRKQREDDTSDTDEGSDE